jgi:dTDP-4-dehydrorhamnose reductase
LMTHKYIITGATGKVGTFLIGKLKGEDYIGISRTGLGKNIVRLDLTMPGSLKQTRFNDFDTVIHLAAKAHIDNCEEDRLLGKEGQTWTDNVVATQNVVDFCKKTNKKLIFLSTECVFDGVKESYSEDDIPNPINWYGETKLAAEKIVAGYPNSLILRTVMAYDSRPQHHDIVANFASKLSSGSEIKAATDQKVSFTYTGDIVDAILTAAEKNLSGLYHFAGSDILSVYDLAIRIANMLKINAENVIPTDMSQILGEKRAKLRLNNSILKSSKFIKETGFKPVSIQEGLKKSLKVFNENVK